jgi:uncharacterized alpha-E superfamily protein
MLSRTADHLYWMSRYLERAESLARMLDAHHRLSLLPRPADAVLRGWVATLEALGALEHFRERLGRVSAARAFAFLAYDREYPGSIVGCLRAARENARAVRGTVTSEMWETINSTYLEVRALDRERRDANDGEFLEWVKDRAHLIRGVTVSTMLRDEAFHFTRLGEYLERADNTARTLQARWRESEAGADSVAADASEWPVMLRAQSAFEVYRRVYRESVSPQRVTELFVLRENMPRSLHRCLQELHRTLRAIANEQSAETERRAGALHAELRFGRLDQLAKQGMAEYLESFLERLGDIGQRIAQDFLVSAATH